MEHGDVGNDRRVGRVDVKGFVDGEITMNGTVGGGYVGTVCSQGLGMERLETVIG